MKEKIFLFVETRVLPLVVLGFAIIFNSAAKGESGIYLNRLQNQAEIDEVRKMHWNSILDLAEFRTHLAEKYNLEYISENEFYTHLNSEELSEYQSKIKNNQLRGMSPGPNCAC